MDSSIVPPPSHVDLSAHITLTEQRRRKERREVTRGTDWIEEEGKFPDRLDNGTDDCGGKVDEIPNGDHQTGRTESCSSDLLLLFSGEGFDGRIREVGIC